MNAHSCFSIRKSDTSRETRKRARKRVELSELWPRPPSPSVLPVIVQKWRKRHIRVATRLSRMTHFWALTSLCAITTTWKRGGGVSFLFAFLLEWLEYRFLCMHFQQKRKPLIMICIQHEHTHTQTHTLKWCLRQNTTCGQSVCVCVRFKFSISLFKHIYIFVMPYLPSLVVTTATSGCCFVYIFCHTFSLRKK